MTAAVYCPDCGCVGCTVATDNFDDASTTGWTTTGTVTEASGLMDLVQGSTAIFDTASASVSHDVAIRTDPLNTDDAAELRLRVCYTDANNYLFGQFLKFDDAGTIRATLRLGQVLGGSETWLTESLELEDTDADLDARGEICVSFRPGPSSDGEQLIASGYAEDSDGPGSQFTDEDEMLGPDDDVGGLGSSLPGGVQRNFYFRGLTAPPGSTIDGITVDIRCRRAAGLGGITVESVQLAGFAGTAVGDDKAASNAVPTGSYGVLGFGATNDDWNAGLTWADLPFLTVLTDFDTSGSSTQLDIDSVLVAVYFTTPDQEAGSLRIAYTNTGSPNTIQCVTAPEVANPAGGLKTGLHAVAGDWDFDTYTLNCTPCGCDEGGDDEGSPCSCCDPEFPPAFSYVLDLGAAFLSDDECAFCDTVAGEITVVNVSTCIWQFDQTIDPACNPPSFACNISRIIYRLGLISDGAGGCKWTAGIGNPIFQDPGTSCEPFGQLLGYYESASLSSEEDCQSLPVTLNLIVERNDLCGGNFPATITLEAP